MAQLEFTNLQKRFGGTQALKGVSFTVRSGEVMALLGENGAGKSTLIKILGGIHKPDAGAISIDGVPYRHETNRSVGAEAPVAFVHQDLGLVEWMTIAENVSLANGYPRWGGGTRGLIDWAAGERLAAQALARLGCDFDPGRRVSSLTRTEKSLVAIARSLATRCDFLVLDEPTASLPADEVEKLLGAVRRLRDAGVGIIYVSHRLDEIFRIADRVVVLRDGAVTGLQAVAETSSEQLVEMIVGAGALRAFEKRPPAARPAARVTVRGLEVADVGPVDFDICSGEILGLVGLRGAGQEAVGRALFGALAHRGVVEIDGVAPDLGSPQTALVSGIGLVARDRAEESIAGSLSIRENTFLNPAARGRRLLSFGSRRREREAARALGRKVGLRPNSPDLAIEGLSGGNQQKVVVGRWLDTGRKLLILEDPTAGVDVGAKAEIYRLVDTAVAEGLTVLVVSTDFEEIAMLCHRALVFNRGRIIAELTGAEVTTERVIATASAAEAA
ncbi:sugar ABC transporter ATP-binding protein [Aureimonas sp. Leaf454]|uniref:sugar ABC transporter ATP-binding protein n=1 Tax=Aureimonas sp. Leaf454 TaxID=1736381 RepID=UPI000701AFE5|nr:sugar ABC transporter ATP-binding protein [Aureimonas sp. Leaf454]KQT54667.1 sugar ABC transporter ATP-binding protein [Aureimonas sp. Leaf454]